MTYRHQPLETPTADKSCSEHPESSSRHCHPESTKRRKRRRSSSSLLILAVLTTSCCLLESEKSWNAWAFQPATASPSRCWAQQELQSKQSQHSVLVGSTPTSGRRRWASTSTVTTELASSRSFHVPSIPFTDSTKPQPDGQRSLSVLHASTTVPPCGGQECDQDERSVRKSLFRLLPGHKKVAPTPSSSSSLLTTQTTVADLAQPTTSAKERKSSRRKLTAGLGNLFSSLSSSQTSAVTTTASSARRKEQDLVEAAYQRRKEEWACKYTSVDALRETFGSNRNVVWGDLDASTTRRLYKTLLPKALLELYYMGVKPEDLAPLAYRARVAAKLYARERSSVPTRVAANLYDGFRQWRRYGSFNTRGMSYKQIWEKYSAEILDECRGEEGLTDDDVTAKICLKILERSCSTNEMVDKLVLSNARSDEEKQDLQEFTDTLENDVRRLLQPVVATTARSAVMDDRKTMAKNAPSSPLSAERIRTLRRVVRIKRRLEGNSSRTGKTTSKVGKKSGVLAATEAASVRQDEAIHHHRQYDATPDSERETSAQHRGRSTPFQNRTKKTSDRRRNWARR